MTNKDEAVRAIVKKYVSTWEAKVGWFDSCEEPPHLEMLFTNAISEALSQQSEEVKEPSPVSVECKTCNGTGNEICNNPDHGMFLSPRFEGHANGCPCCGNDELHRIKGTVCEDCNGTGVKPVSVDVEELWNKHASEQFSDYGTMMNELSFKEAISSITEKHGKEVKSLEESILHWSAKLAELQSQYDSRELQLRKEKAEMFTEDFIIELLQSIVNFDNDQRLSNAKSYFAQFKTQRKTL